MYSYFFFHQKINILISFICVYKEKKIIFLVEKIFPAYMLHFIFYVLNHSKVMRNILTREMNLTICFRNIKSIKIDIFQTSIPQKEIKINNF